MVFSLTLRIDFRVVLSTLIILFFIHSSQLCGTSSEMKDKKKKKRDVCKVKGV